MQMKCLKLPHSYYKANNIKKTIFNALQFINPLSTHGGSDAMLYSRVGKQERNIENTQHKRHSHVNMPFRDCDITGS